MSSPTKEQTIDRLESKLKVVKDQRERLSDLLADEAVGHGETRILLRKIVDATEPTGGKSCIVCGGTGEIVGVPGLHRDGCAWVAAWSAYVSGE